MGKLNMAGYRASTGDYIMLLNDDVLVKTPQWDIRVRSIAESFPDGIVLIHVNDMIFEEKLCTFPLVSRVFCDFSGGICPEGFLRYRIDDHIYNVFDLLGTLGQRRIYYLPDVVFEHLNREIGAIGPQAYKPNEKIHIVDSSLFEKLHEERAKLAAKLMYYILERRTRANEKVWEHCTEKLTDWASLRRPEYVRHLGSEATLSSANTRVTVGVVSANLQSPMSQRCINSIKRYTTNFDLVLIDNNKSNNFNHSREMNRLIDICRTDYLVLMDDDVFVEEGWLDGLLKCIDGKTALVTPCHKNIKGQFSYAGIVMSPDYSGHHTHIFEKPNQPIPVQSICSAVMMLDLNKIGHIKIEEIYQKYFLDIAYGFSVWEAGYRVICTPEVLVTHIGGGTLTHNSEKANTNYNLQRAIFLKSWLDTGRWQRLKTKVWTNEPEILAQLNQQSTYDRLKNLDVHLFHGTNRLTSPNDFPLIKTGSLGYRIITFMKRVWHQERKTYTINLSSSKRLIKFIANSVIQIIKKFPIAKRLLRPLWIKLDRSHYRDTRIIRFLRKTLRQQEYKHDDLRPDHAYKMPDLMAKVSTGGKTIVIEESYRGFTILQRDSTFFARPQIHVNDLDADIFWEQTADDVKASIDNKDPIEILSDTNGFSIFRFEYTYFAIPISEAPFVYDKFLNNEYSVCLNAHSVTQLKIEIDRHQRLSQGKPSKTLIFGITDDKQLNQLMTSARTGEVFTLLSEKPKSKKHDGINELLLTPQSLPMLADAIVAGSNKGMASVLKKIGFDQVIIPMEVENQWSYSTIERAATLLAGTVEILTRTGNRHSLTGENAHRLVYNKHYLTNLFKHLPLPENCSVLEIGCGDGLVCEYMVNFGAKQVVGVDVMQTAGCNFPSPKIKYLCRNAQNLSFPDQSFDMIYSIATFEHISDPQSVFDEIIRLVKIGGYFYIQAGPLYHSPFGHHMFNYFTEYPWIHLRKSSSEILRYAEITGAASRINEDMAVSAEQYINSMLSHQHINGRLLDQYGLDTFRSREDIKEISFSISYEGTDLLTPNIIAELRDYDPNWLVQHGFEVVGQRIR